MLRPEHRLVLLQHGGLADLSGKTGLAMLRYRPGPIVAVVDPQQAGRPLRQAQEAQTMQRRPLKSGHHARLPIHRHLFRQGVLFGAKDGPATILQQQLKGWLLVD